MRNECSEASPLHSAESARSCAWRYQLDFERTNKACSPNPKYSPTVWSHRKAPRVSKLNLYRSLFVCIIFIQLQLAYTVPTSLRFCIFKVFSSSKGIRKHYCICVELQYLTMVVVEEQNSGVSVETF